MGKKNIIIAFVIIGALVLIASVGRSAYQHMGERDSQNFLSAYSTKKGTKLDSCTTCHTGGSYTSNGKTTTLGACQWCHYKYGYDGSGDITATLNQYGIDYNVKGRNAKALKLIEKMDSDGDGFTNAEEIKANRYPGDRTDDPTKVTAPSVILSKKELEAMPQHTQFLLMNTSKAGDFYAEYTGVTMEQILASARIADTSTNIKVIAPDGFSTYHPLTEDVTNPNFYHVYGIYPQATYHYDPSADTALNPGIGWCDYVAPSCAGRKSGDPIIVPGGLKMLLAIKRDGEYLTPGVLSSSNKLDGEGPYRVVPPQKNEGPPDQASTSPIQNVLWPYNSKWDHNAGFATRSVTMIKVEPLPPGTTDINVYEAGWPYIDKDQIVVYGNIIRAVSINGDAGCTTSSTVSLALNPPGTPDRMIISNRNPTFMGMSVPYVKNKQWRLGFGKGMKDVYVWFKTGNTVQGPFSSSIYVAQTCPSVTASIGD